MDAAEQVLLPDGRLLDMRVSGPAGGLPLVFHHGTPGPATPVHALERAAHARGLRLVTTSRPAQSRSRGARRCRNCAYDADDLDWMAGMGEQNVVEFAAAARGEDTLRPVPASGG